MCSDEIKGMGLLNQSTDWFGIVLVSIKGVSATPTLWQVACVQYKGHRDG